MSDDLSAASARALHFPVYRNRRRGAAGNSTLPEEIAAVPVVVRALPQAIDLILGRAEDTGK